MRTITEEDFGYLDDFRVVVLSTLYLVKWNSVFYIYNPKDIEVFECKETTKDLGEMLINGKTEILDVKFKEMIIEGFLDIVQRVTA